MLGTKLRAPKRAAPILNCGAISPALGECVGKMSLLEVEGLDETVLSFDNGGLSSKVYIRI